MFGGTNQGGLSLSTRQVVLAAAFFMMLGFFLTKRDAMNSSHYDYKTGKLDLLNTEQESIARSIAGNYRYVSLEDDPMVYELLVTPTGPEAFHPLVNKIDQLAIGDSIEIFYEEDLKIIKDDVNLLTQIVKRDGEVMYQKKQSDRMLGIIVMSISGAALLFGLFMTGRKK